MLSWRDGRSADAPISKWRSFGRGLFEPTTCRSGRYKLFQRFGGAFITRQGYVIRIVEATTLDVGPDRINAPCKPLSGLRMKSLMRGFTSGSIAFGLRLCRHQPDNHIAQFALQVSPHWVFLALGSRWPHPCDLYSSDGMTSHSPMLAFLGQHPDLPTGTMAFGRRHGYFVGKKQQAADFCAVRTF